MHGFEIKVKKEQEYRIKLIYVLRCLINLFRVLVSRILVIKNAKFSGYYFYINANIWRDFQICIKVPLKSKLKKYFIFKERLQWYYLFVKISFDCLLLVFDCYCSLVRKVGYTVESVFVMLAKNDFKIVGGGVRTGFALYFYPSHAWIWFKKVPWESEISL